jgi:hypothetical protein
MPNEPLALAVIPPDALNDDDYRTLCEALSESARGRAFLAEYARRNRHADTEALLEAIERIEARLRTDASAVQRLRDDLRMLLIAIRLARPEIDAAGPAARAVKLAALLDLLERRIDAMSEAKPAALAPSAERPSGAALAVVPALDEPELPIPSSAGFEPRPVSLIGGAPPAPVVNETKAAAPRDPLAALMALSEEERIALFT